VAGSPRKVTERLVELFETQDPEHTAGVDAEDVVIDHPTYG
jgi:hypothetical protein